MLYLEFLKQMASNQLSLIALSTILVFTAWVLSWDGRSHGVPYISHGKLLFCCSKFHSHSMIIDGALYFSHDALQVLHSKEDIVAVVKRAHNEHLKVRVLGSGHSWSPIATSDGLTVSLHHYHGLVSHDVGKKQVTIRGGTTLSEMNTILDGLGLALSNLPSISDQTIAGTIATGMLWPSTISHEMNYCQLNPDFLTIMHAHMIDRVITCWYVLCYCSYSWYWHQVW